MGRVDLFFILLLFIIFKTIFFIFRIIPIVETSYLSYVYAGTLQGYKDYLIERFLTGERLKYAPIWRRTAMAGVTGGPTHNSTEIPERLFAGSINFCAGTPMTTAICWEMAVHFSKNGISSILNEPTQSYFLTKENLQGDCSILFDYPSNFVYELGDVIGFEFDENDKLKLVPKEESKSQTKPSVHIYTYVSSFSSFSCLILL